MEVKIGVVYTARELTVEIDSTEEEIRGLVDDAVKGEAAILWLTDRRGRQVGVPSDKLAYVEFVADDSRQVGFGRG